VTSAAARPSILSRAFRAMRERHAVSSALRTAETAACKTRRSKVLPHLQISIMKMSRGAPEAEGRCAIRLGRRFWSSVRLRGG
jgi:hypothetical protein